MAARLREHYQKKVIPALTKEFGYSNVMAVPKIDKISINIGLGEATQNAKLMDGAVNELGQIAGQKPVVTKATKSIAQFKLREGQAIGCAVTLRGDRMYEFFDRLVNVALPRVRDPGRRRADPRGRIPGRRGGAAAVDDARGDRGLRVGVRAGLRFYAVWSGQLHSTFDLRECRTLSHR
jgi:ribosomal protein L5